MAPSEPSHTHTLSLSHTHTHTHTHSHTHTLTHTHTLSLSLPAGGRAINRSTTAYPPPPLVNLILSFLSNSRADHRSAIQKKDSPSPRPNLHGRRLVDRPRPEADVTSSCRLEKTAAPRSTRCSRPLASWASVWTMSVFGRTFTVSRVVQVTFCTFCYLLLI